MKLRSIASVLLAAGGLFVAAQAGAATLTIQSNGSTLAGATPLNDPALLSGDTTGVTFGADTVGALGSFTVVPAGAPAGTEVINISSTMGASGFFKVDFTLPTDFIDASISGAANIDDYGVVFLNNTSLAQVGEVGSTPFASTDSALFQPGQNEFLVSDDNGKGGPSAATFYAYVSYVVSPAPEASTWALMILGAGFAGVALRRGRRALPI